jgi:hypothetical protein
MRQPLAVLRPPTREEASPWYTGAPELGEGHLAAVVETVLEMPGARLMKRGPCCAEIDVADVPGAAPAPPFRITLTPARFELRRRLELVRPGAPRETRVELIQPSNFATVLQMASSFYVFSDELLGFEPVGECAPCRREAFEWQDFCLTCEHPLYERKPGEEPFSGRAKRVATALLRHKMVELATPRGRRALETALTAYYELDAPAPEALHSLLLDMPDIAEVYCDEARLFYLLCRVL